MAVNYYYNYAEIDLSTNMCVGVQSTSREYDLEQYPEFVAIPVCDDNYIMKYYNWDNEKFYYDAEYTQEYISPLL